MRSPADDAAAPWWAGRRYALLLVLLAGIPLVWPALPPLTDALGHLARYHVELALDSSPYLSRWYGFRWALVGNLGVDLLVVPLSAVFGVQLATKLIVLAIPMVTVAGFLAVAREVHGRLPPTAAFAVPLAYGYPFHFGFINFCLSMGLALLAFALWLRLGRLGRRRLRAALFVPAAMLLWLCHIYGWGVLGLLAFCAELLRPADGRRLPRRVWDACVAMLPLAPPLLLMLVWRSGDVAGFTGDWFNMAAKARWLAWSLRDRWMWLDVGSVALVVCLLYAGFTRSLRFAPVLALATLVLVATYLLLPRILLGSAYADMRLVPYMLAVGVLALAAPPSPRAARLLALGALAFAVVRIGATTASFAILDRDYGRQLAALDHVPRGSRIMALVSIDCRTNWVANRMDHLASQGIVRRDAFVNGQWAMPGAQLLTVHYPAAGRFALDPSQLLRPRRCRGRGEPIWEDTLANFPRAAFDYLWLIDIGPERWPRDPGLKPVWSFPRGILYRVDARAPKADYSATSASDTPNGRLPRPSQ